MKKELVLFGAGEYGKNALQVIGRKEVAFFLDNNKSLHGKSLDGIEIRYFPEVIHLQRYQIVITVSLRYYTEIENDLKRKGIYTYYSVDQYLKMTKYCISDWTRYKNLYWGKRCFLLGSGPSLTLDDLNQIYEKGELSFGANKIFKIFEQTRWRPDFYCATDRRILSFYQETIANLELSQMFIAYYHDRKLQKLADALLKKDNVNLFAMKESVSDDEIEFSEDPSEFIVEGRTVIYAMMQIALYMGFKEIYLLGVDFNYSDPTGYDKKGQDHFCKNYIEEGEEVLISSQQYCLKAFEKAKKYSQKHGVKIYNATRGGKLEVFERVDLESIIWT